MMTSKEHNKRVGPGGYKCTCCGPAPRHRKAWRRMLRSADRQAFKRHLTEVTCTDS